MEARRFHLVWALALCALAVSVPLAQARAAHHHPPARHRGPSQVAVAKRLVGRLAKAHGDKAQFKATLAIMRALHISVVSSSGKPLVTSPEPNAAREFALYDFEVQALGSSLERGPVTDLGGVAADLTKAGLTLDGSGRPFPEALLREALLGAVKQAKGSPRSPRTLLPLIVRELGLRQSPRYDLAAHKVPATIRLDALQAWLIGADIEVSVLRHIPNGAHPKAAARPAVASSLPDSCAELTQKNEELSKKIEAAIGGKVQKWIAEKGLGMIYEKVAGVLGRKVTRWGISNLPNWIVRGTYETVKAASLVGPILDAIHGVLLSYSVDVRAVHESLSTHWLHAPGEGGRQMTFEVKVTMLDDYGELAVKCGKLAGFQMPPPGPIEGVPVLWGPGNDSASLAPDMGTLECSALCITKTGKDGIAKVVFTPRTEEIPGVGLERESHGTIDGYAAYQTAEGSGIPEQVAQFLTPKYGGVAWSVTYHKEPNLTLSLVDRHDETFTNANEGSAIGGHYMTTGSGAGHFAISSLAPAQKVTTTDGTSLWTGDGPINWDTFSYSDDGASMFCLDGKWGTDDEDGSAPRPGELEVDSIQRDPKAAAPGLVVTFHASVEPSYTTTASWNHGESSCPDSTNTIPTDWWLGPESALSGPQVNYVAGPADEHASPVYRVGGWQPGPALHGGEGVYAYREFSYDSSDAWGQPYSGSLRLEIRVTPAP